MADLPTLTDEERLALQHRLRSPAPEIDDAIKKATGQYLPFVLLTCDGETALSITNANREFASYVMMRQLARWDEQQDALPSTARQH